MKLVITEKEQGKIIANQTVIKLEVNPFVSDAGKIPLALFSSKGDLIVGKGGLNPVRLPIGSDGQTLVVNDSSLSGLSWKTIGWGTVSLINAEALPVTAGTVCTQADDPGTFRTATDADTENLYVASENILSGQIGVLFAASGASCYVLCTSAAVNAGENLEVSSTPGMAQKATSGTVFATAMTSKPAGVVSQVQCILTNSTLTVTPITGGGTGATTAAAARTNLGLGNSAVKNAGSATVSFAFTGTSKAATVTELPAGALVWIEPAESSRAAFYAADVRYSTHSANSLTLVATSNPGTVSVIVGWLG